MNPGKTVEKAVKGFFIGFLAFIIPEHKNNPIPSVGSIKSILVIRPDRLGDFILTVPAIAALKDAMPEGAKLTILCGTRGLEIAKQYFGGKARIITYKKGLGSFIFCAAKIVFRHDVVINFHSYPFSMTSSMLTLFSFCRIRIGFRETEFVKNVLAPKVYNKGIVLNDDSMHEKDKNIALIHVLGVEYNSNLENIKPQLPSAALSYSEEFYRLNNIKQDDIVIGIHPTLMKKDNRWEQERYLEFASMAVSSLGAKIIIVHGMGEDVELEKFRKMAGINPGIFYYPEANIISIMAAAREFDCFVCNDSGIMHAAALVTDVVAVFGPSVLSRWTPLGSYKKICLQKTDGRCMSVTAREALDAVTLLTAGRVQ
jgi:ADP-heptose:LPS heptosyltransferase